MKINPVLETLLLPAYEPCTEFHSACTHMRWKPSEGHVPRGFLGGAGTVEEVELVLVFAEPGDPHAVESHNGLSSAYEYANFAVKSGQDEFHRNVRRILDSCWPELSFEEQMRKAWLTDSVLCSAPKECGPVPKSTERSCGQRYLIPQLRLFPDALVVALGGKAQKRLRALGFKSFLPVYSVAPPGCRTHKKQAQASWDAIPAELARRRNNRS